MSPENAAYLKAMAIDNYYFLNNPTQGPNAAGGRYSHFFPRDFERAAKPILECNSFIDPRLLQPIGRGIATIIASQGQKYDERTGEEVGRVMHESTDSRFTDRQRLEELRYCLPVDEDAEGNLKLRTYFANDTTAGFIETVGLFARTKMGKERIDYLEKIYPAVLSAYKNQTEISDIDGDGLIEAKAPGGYSGFDHNERDSLFTYQLDSTGKSPEGPWKYSSTNAIWFGALQQMAWICGELGLNTEQKQSLERRQEVKEKYRKLFWNKNLDYPTPLIFGDDEQADFINDEALDGMLYGIWTMEQNQKIKDRLSKPDMNTYYWGQRTRSNNSPGFYRNGKEAYWNGMVWLHRVSQGFLAYKQAGFEEEATIAAKQYFSLVQERGFIELEGVDEDGKLFPYDEGQGPVACKPQLFGIGGAFGIVGYYLADNPQFSLAF